MIDPKPVKEMKSIIAKKLKKWGNYIREDSDQFYLTAEKEEYAKSLIREMKSECSNLIEKNGYKKYRFIDVCKDMGINLSDNKYGTWQVAINIAYREVHK